LISLEGAFSNVLENIKFNSLKFATLLFTRAVCEGAQKPENIYIKERKYFNVQEDEKKRV
jgi:hypothetical protein